MGNIPIEQNNDDIQDLTNFPRDSFVDHTPYRFNNNNNVSSMPFQKSQQFSYRNLENNNGDNSSSDEFESGYSSQFAQEKPLYDNKRENQNQNYNINTPQDNTYFNQPHISEPGNYLHKIPRPAVEPIPQDSIVEEEEEEEEVEIMNNDINQNINLQNIPTNMNLENIPTNMNLENLPTNMNLENIPTNMNLQNIPTNINLQNNPPNINIDINRKKNNIERLYELCRKNGTPPPDGDFSLEGWKLFYPPDEKFFLWEKGKTIPNRVLVYNEKDEEKLEIYEGEINKKNEKHGFGILTSPKYVRKGTWRDGEFTGWCRESRINGDIFEGKFIDGAIFGKGINKNHKGNLYVGDFVDSKREGKGELKTQRIHYEGDFKYDKFNGKGKLEFVKEGHSYEGEFKNNEINGMGIFKWSNGDVYEGEMTCGKMNGYGKYTYSNGQIYEGNYVNGIKEGLGKLIYPNKKIYEGEFKNGKPMGEGTLFINGKKVDIIYKNGKFQKK